MKLGQTLRDVVTGSEMQLTTTMKASCSSKPVVVESRISSARALSASIEHWRWRDLPGRSIHVDHSCTLFIRVMCPCHNNPIRIPLLFQPDSCFHGPGSSSLQATISGTELYNIFHDCFHIVPNEVPHNFGSVQGMQSNLISR